MDEGGRDAGVIRATFVMEQQLGHRTFYENLRRSVDRLAEVEAAWVEVAYRRGSRAWEHLPGIDRVLAALRGRDEVRQGARTTPADVRFFNTQVPAVLGGRDVRRGPYVLCTDVTPVQYDRMAGAYGHHADGAGPIARLKFELNRNVFRGAASCVAWSTWVRDSLVTDYGVDPGRVHVISPGVETARWAVGRTFPSSSQRPLRILFVGGDLHRKGGDLLLSAFRSLPEGLAEVVLVTRTPHPGGAGVRVERGMSPNTPELISLYRSSDVFVIPSAGETFGIAAVEASAVGLPVIATKIGGLTDIVADGETGFLIDVGDQRALAARLRMLAEDPELRSRLGAAARRRAVDHFDADANGRRIVEVLKAAATDGRTHALRSHRPQQYRSA